MVWTPAYQRVTTGAHAHPPRLSSTPCRPRGRPQRCRAECAALPPLGAQDEEDDVSLEGSETSSDETHDSDLEEWIASEEEGSEELVAKMTATEEDIEELKFMAMLVPFRSGQGGFQLVCGARDAFVRSVGVRLDPQCF